MNEFILQYLSKEVELLIHSQDYLDAITHSLITMSRAVLKLKIAI